ncbi:MAG: YraN family protein [Thiohalomonadaceae bacterium]
MASTKALGDEAEHAALRHLADRGLELVARNFRCRCGEIDLVMRDGATHVFVEVRYRSGSRFGSAAETVDRRKQQRVITAAQLFLQRHPRVALGPCRFDVVALRPATDGGWHIEWIQNAFELV